MTTIRQRMRGLLATLNRYAEALESNPCDILVDRVHRLEEKVERMKHSPDRTASEASSIDLH